MTRLFETFALRDVTLKNRVVIAPMCTYASTDGFASDWHFAHYAKLAMGGAAMVITEATSVSADGRHSYADLGIWQDDHVPGLRRITDFLKSEGCVPAIQLQHAGRKASARRPWHGASPLDGEDVTERGEHPWQTVGPSETLYCPEASVPTVLDHDGIRAIIAEWVAATRRAVAAGFEVVEIHAAHGYLLNQFLSPIANQRNDEYGGDTRGRMRLTLEVVEAVRAAWPQDKPLMVRLSCVDAVDGGWTLDETVELATELKARGVDAIDCSSGGIGGSATMNRIARGPGFQVPFARRVRQDAQIATIAVGLIITPEQAAEVVDDGSADLVAIARQALVDPNWPNAARTRLLPDDGYRHWGRMAGWWLDKRASILAQLEPVPSTTRPGA